MYFWMDPLWLPLTKSESGVSWKRLSGIAALLVLAAAGGVGLAENEPLYGSSGPARRDYDSGRRASARQQEGTPLSPLSAPAASSGLHISRVAQEQRTLQIFSNEATVRLPHMTDRPVDLSTYRR